MELTTSFQQVGYVAVGSASGATYYQGIYAKYSRTEAQRVARKSTIDIEVRVFDTGAKSTEWGANTTWSGTFNGLLTNAWSKMLNHRGTNIDTVYSTSIEVQHDSSGNYSSTIGATNVKGAVFGGNHTIASTTITLPRIILNPDVVIVGAGTSSNPVVMSGNTNITVNVTNTAGASTTIYLKVYDGGVEKHSYTLKTVSSDGNTTVTIPISMWDYFPSRDYDNGSRIYVSNSNGSMQALLHSRLSENVKPTVNSVVISGTNPSSASTLGSNLVKGITIPKITTAATPVYSSPISRYELRAFTGYDDTLPKDITQVFNGTRPFNALNVTATVRVYDARNHYAELTSNAVSVVDYSFPSLTCSVKRCNSSGTLDEDGTYGKLFIDYAIAPIHIGSADKNIKTLEYSLNDGSTWTAITTSSYSGHIEQKIGTGTFTTTGTFNVWVRIKDLVNETTTKLQIVPSFTTVSLHSGGKGVTIGRVSTADELQVYMQTHLRNGLYIGDTLVLYDDGN